MRRRLVILLAAALLASCAREERVVGYKPFFAGLAGQSSDITVSGPGAELARAASTPGAAGGSGTGGRPVRTVTEEQAKGFVVNPDGSKKLMIRSARELIGQVRVLMSAGERDVPEAQELFYEQVLCPQTRAEFKARGMGPAEAYAYLKNEERELLRLFDRMPMGEHTPTAVTEDLGGNTQRVRLTRSAAKGLKWVGVDMVMSQGRLVPAAVPEGAAVPTVTTAPPEMDLQASIARARTRSEAEEMAQRAREAKPKYRWEGGQWGLRWFVPGGG
ncbi:MAG: hypothetical protein IT437_03350 [Phycisphaerales bacterium]|nr:hypothetical protein [Phycisphaerales bacterium]